MFSYVVGPFADDDLWPKSGPRWEKISGSPSLRYDSASFHAIKKFAHLRMWREERGGRQHKQPQSIKLIDKKLRRKIARCLIANIKIWRTMARCGINYPHAGAGSGELFTVREIVSFMLPIFGPCRGFFIFLESRLFRAMNCRLRSVGEGVHRGESI